MSAVHDADNRQVTYTYTGGNLTDVKDVLGQDTVYQYDGGRLTYKADAAGRPTYIKYDSYGNVASVTDQNGVGHFFQYDYDQSSRQSYARIETSSGAVKEIWYDGDGDTVRVDVNGRTVKKIAKDGRDLIISDEKGNITRKDYDQWDNLTRVTYPDGSTVSFEYDLRFNKVSRVVDQLGNVTTFAYDDAGNLTEKIEAAGTDVQRTTVYTYNADNQLLSATIEGSGSEPDVSTQLSYDEDGNLASLTDPEGNLTQFTQYDDMGNLLRMIDPAGNTWRFSFDDAGRLVSQTDALGRATTYEYDGANNRTAIVNALLKRFDFEYDDHNNLIRAVDPYEKYLTTDYNTDNLPTRVTDREGKQSRSEYDNEGRLTRTIDGAGNAVVYTYDESAATRVSSHLPVQIDYPTYSRTFTYDVMGRVVKTRDDLKNGITHTTTTSYDAAGRVTSTTDAQGNTTTYTYDALGRLTQTVDALGDTVTRTYDGRGNLVQVEDPNHGITFYDYDKDNRLTKIIRPMLEETTYEYDARGNRTAVIDSKGQHIAYTYDAVNRLTRVRYYKAGDSSVPVKTVDFTYDALGHLTGYDDGTTTGSYTYDDLGRQLTETVDYGAFTKTLTTAYFANGLKKSQQLPGSEALNYAYDENNRLTAVNIPGQGQITTTYDAAHWNSPAKVLRPGGGSTTYAYDPLMQVTSIVARDPAQNVSIARTRQYSPSGAVTGIDTEHGSYSYEYDKLYRLTRAVNPTLPDEQYTYDAMGNRLTAADTTGPWTYNADNQLLHYDTKSFAYDANGNMISRSDDGVTTKYVYDTEDRLVRVEDQSGNAIAEYYYDPFGRRLWKDVDGVRTCYLYSDEGLVAEYDQTGIELRQYGWNPGSAWGTDPLFLKQGNSYYWYENDARGAPQKLVATNGSVVWSGVYDAFGKCHVDLQAVVNNLRLPGQYFDAETGLYYNWNRYYDPIQGRYLRTDTLGEGLNLYIYCFNDPIRMIDPMGLCPKKQSQLIDIKKEFPGLFDIKFPTTGNRYVDNLIISITEPIVKSFMTDNIRNNVLKLSKRIEPYIWIIDVISFGSTLIEIKRNLEEDIKHPTGKVDEYEEMFRLLKGKPDSRRKLPVILA